MTPVHKFFSSLQNLAVVFIVFFSDHHFVPPTAVNVVDVDVFNSTLFCYLFETVSCWLTASV